jgi:hypothetical protein
MGIGVLPVLPQECNALVKGFRRFKSLLDGDLAMLLCPISPSLPCSQSIQLDITRWTIDWGHT